MKRRLQAILPAVLAAVLLIAGAGGLARLAEPREAAEAEPEEANPRMFDDTGHVPIGEKAAHAETLDGPAGSRSVTGTEDIALTFDDGPNPAWTAEVLDILAYYGVRATFCVIGSNAAEHPDLVKRMADEGHTLCNHSWDHDFELGWRPPERIREDLERTNEAIRAAAGEDTPIEYFRQPGGRWTETVVAAAEDLGMDSLHWTVEASDWSSGTGSGAIRDAVVQKAVPGSIVLLHDGGGDQSATVEALGPVLDGLWERERSLAAF
ncbi:polysaccharide deacetylase family protein [Salininema proteolyticum]|uniref:Polysaccharide deacetylase family protein n=1 Tax=Salininema proteolyticum TaxID=1607685 RepID=A0ABV8TUN2_9ACTN